MISLLHKFNMVESGMKHPESAPVLACSNSSETSLMMPNTSDVYHFKATLGVRYTVPSDVKNHKQQIDRAHKNAQIHLLTLLYEPMVDEFIALEKIAWEKGDHDILNGIYEIKAKLICLT